MFVHRVFAHIVVGICLATITTRATFLPPEEKDALQQIAKTMGKTDWNFGADPCGGELGWATPNAKKGYESAVTCTPNCSSSTTGCHIISIILKRQNLSGQLPPELVRLPYLQEIDLTRTYLNGTIPREWGSMKLVNITVLGSRVTGPIPKELGNISTLEKLSLEFNLLSGHIPPELGDLPRIEKIHLTSNNLSGELPGSLANLLTLKEFRIGGNNFTGKIPNFIQNWKSLEKLGMQGSGLDGPIPSGIALLKNLSDLRISDLNGAETSFPNVSNMRNMQTLTLRSCNIVGTLPDYFVNMPDLQTLDLSFNKLTGNIPDSFIALRDTRYIFLTGNSLSGSVPNWLLERRYNTDLSYNNFTYDSSQGLDCQTQGVNLFSSFSGDNAAQIVSCLGNVQCQQNHTSFHINCGGRAVDNDTGTRYVDDTNQGGPSSFVKSDNWAFSQTGRFLDGNISDFFSTTRSPSALSINNSELYMTARLSPQSLTYYGFCLQNGSYTVKLHFAEIMFTDDRTFSSLGRRIFDIYIQRNLTVKGFNIADEAGGVRKPVVKRFFVAVTSGTLEIRFNWAGKGTTGIPDRGVYGPLISAISVELDRNGSSTSSLVENKGNGTSAGTVVGIVAAVVAFVILLALGILRWKGCLPCRVKQSMPNQSNNPLISI